MKPPSPTEPASATPNPHRSTEPTSRRPRWITPIAVLFALNLVDEFDRYAFATLAPEIRDAFGLDDTGIAALRAIPGVLSLVVAIPIGMLADRTNRARLAVAAGTIAAISSAVTGLTGALWVLFLARFGAGTGRVANEVVHPSLIGDLYPPHHRPRIFGIHRLANALGPLAAVAAGLIAAAAGWRTAFVILAIPTAIAVAAALTLHEPPRGHTEPDQPPPTAQRSLIVDPILRRVWVAAFLFGTVTLQLDVFISLTFDERWTATSAVRGITQLVFGAGIVAGIAIGTRFARRQPHEPNKLTRIAATGGAPVIVGLTTLAIAPTQTAAIAATLIVGIGFGAYQPAYFTLVAARTTSRLRARAYALALCAYGIGGIAYLPLQATAPNPSITAGVLAAVMATAVITLVSAPREPGIDEPAR